VPEVGKRDALGWDFEVHYGGFGRRLQLESKLRRLGNSLRTR